MTTATCAQCGEPLDASARALGRCPACKAVLPPRWLAPQRPVTGPSDTPTTAATAPTPGAPSDPPAGVDAASPDAGEDDATLADLTWAELQAHADAAAAVDHAAATLAIDPSDAADDAVDHAAATLALDPSDAPPDDPDDIATLALDPSDAPSDAQPDDDARQIAATAGGEGRASVTRQGAARQGEATRVASGSETSATGASGATGSLRRYADGALVTLSGDEVNTAGAAREAFALPYARADVIRRIGGYDVLGELGRGGMGVVYKAYSLRLCRLVALKMMTAGSAASEAQLVRFQNEAMLAARLTHPNIVPVFDAGEHEGNFFFVMGYVEGRGFGDLIADTSPAGLELGLRVLARTARALAYAHKRGIVHRDIKPDNILVDADDEPQITDFGIAKNVEREVSLTKPGAMLGTPAYMAPEQANTVLDRVGPLTDVYSLGATLYHLLTGQQPFTGPTALAVLVAVLEKEPDPPRTAARKNGRKIDPDLELICLRAMEKRAGDRYPSALAFAEDLEAFLEQRPISARPVGIGERVTKLVRRNRAAFVGGLVAFTTLIMLAVGFGVVMAVNIERTSDSLRVIDRQAGVDQASTLERSIVVNMRQGRADVVRELVNALRADPKLTRIEVVRPDKSLAYSDLSTRKAVERRLAKEQVQQWVDRELPAMSASVAMLKTVALDKIDAAEAVDDAPRFEVDDDAWREILGSDDVLTRVDDVGGIPHLTVIKTIPNGRACQVCHGSVREPGTPLPAHEQPAPSGVFGGGGDDDHDYADERAWDPDNRVRAVLVVRRSLEEVENQISENRRWTLLVGGGTALVFLALLFLFARVFGVRLRPHRFGKNGKARGGAT